MEGLQRNKKNTRPGRSLRECWRQKEKSDGVLAPVVDSPKLTTVGTQKDPVVCRLVKDSCVGEHVSGELFLWRGIFDMDRFSAEGAGVVRVSRYVYRLLVS